MNTEDLRGKYYWICSQVMILIKCWSLTEIEGLGFSIFQFGFWVLYFSRRDLQGHLSSSLASFSRTSVELLLCCHYWTAVQFTEYLRGFGVEILTSEKKETAWNQRLADQSWWPSLCIESQHFYPESLPTEPRFGIKECSLGAGWEPRGTWNEIWTFPLVLILHISLLLFLLCSLPSFYSLSDLGTPFLVNFLVFPLGYNFN